MGPPKPARNMTGDNETVYMMIGKHITMATYAWYLCITCVLQAYFTYTATIMAQERVGPRIRAGLERVMGVRE